MKGILIACAVAGIATTAVCAAADPYQQATAGQTPLVAPQYFGTHMHRLVLEPGEKAVPTRWPTIGIGSIRLWDSHLRWANIAPKPGEWNFQRFDTYVHTAVAQKAEVLYTLGSTPTWASARPTEACPYGNGGCSAEPVRMAHWEEYVRRVAERYGTRITAYELWNEPGFSDASPTSPVFYSGDTASMVEMARLARKVLDEVVPGTKLCTPGFVNAPHLLERFLAAGGKQYVQAICYHFYAGNLPYFAQIITNTRAIMKRQGVANLPIWNTETGVDFHGYEARVNGLGSPKYEETVERASQMLIMAAAAGIERFYFYAWDSDNSGVVLRNGEARPGHDIYARLRNWLVGSRFSGCAAAADTVRCEAEQEGVRHLIVWSDKLGNRRLVPPAGMRFSAIESLAAAEAVQPPDGAGLAVSAPVGPLPLRLRLEKAR